MCVCIFVSNIYNPIHLQRSLTQRPYDLTKNKSKVRIFVPIENFASDSCYPSVDNLRHCLIVGPVQPHLIAKSTHQQHLTRECNLALSNQKPALYFKPNLYIRSLTIGTTWPRSTACSLVLTEVSIPASDHV